MAEWKRRIRSGLAFKRGLNLSDVSGEDAAGAREAGLCDLLALRGCEPS